jgi:hypothetical protein
MAGELADHDPPALPAVQTALTCLEGSRRGVRRLALPVRGLEGCGRVLTRAQALELVEEGPMDGTPQRIVADVVQPLGQHRRQQAAHARQRWPGHGLPALVLGLLRAEAHVAVRDREHPAMGQRHPVEIAPQIRQD